MSSKLKKVISKIMHYFMFVVEFVNKRVYMKLNQKYLKFLGINIANIAGYIHPSVEFDGVDYTLITIGERTTIRKNVLILTHDYSINRGFHYLGSDEYGRFLKNVEIGNNCFIGARAILLPGTKIGDNVIVGTGAVVKGNIPENSIIVGNPAQVITDLSSWTEKHLALKDYQSLK